MSIRFSHVLLCLILMMFFVGVPKAPAADNMAIIQKQLLEIQKRLEALEEGQKRMMEKQNQLSEEHQQIRYFIVRR